VTFDEYAIPEKYFLLQLERLLDEQQVSTATPHELFASLDDDFWVWALTAGRRESAALREILPDLPADDIQLGAVGVSGDDAIRNACKIYRLMRNIYEAYRGELESADGILDFGCGWGRITRCFLKDVEPDRLWGVDAYDKMITVSRETSRWGNFRQSNPLPPIEFRDSTFDLIFCWSVFSHLSEEAQRQWIDEFARILKPGGLVIATTWDREFIESCRESRDERELPSHHAHLPTMFRDTDAWLARYDRGEFCFESYGDEHSPWHGEACVPKEYVLRHWPQRLKVLDFLDDRGVSRQNVIVARS
jgi:SAM-dependent methyltransferase